MQLLVPRRPQLMGSHPPWRYWKIKLSHLVCSQPLAFWTTETQKWNRSLQAVCTSEMRVKCKSRVECIEAPEIEHIFPYKAPSSQAYLPPSSTALLLCPNQASYHPAPPSRWQKRPGWAELGGWTSWAGSDCPGGTWKAGWGYGHSGRHWWRHWQYEGPQSHCSFGIWADTCSWPWAQAPEAGSPDKWWSKEKLLRMISPLTLHAASPLPKISLSSLCDHEIASDGTGSESKEVQSGTKRPGSLILSQWLTSLSPSSHCKSS